MRLENGHVVVEADIFSVVRCEMNFEAYPLDQQDCLFAIESKPRGGVSPVS